MPVFVFIIKVILNYLFFHLCCKYIEKFRHLWCFLLILCFLTINNHTVTIQRKGIAGYQASNKA